MSDEHAGVHVPLTGDELAEIEALAAQDGCDAAEWMRRNARAHCDAARVRAAAHEAVAQLYEAKDPKTMRIVYMLIDALGNHPRP